MLSGPANTVIVNARKLSSFVLTNTPSWSSTKLSLILGVVLGIYPQAASAAAAPRKEQPQEDARQFQRTHAHSLDTNPIQPVCSSLISISL